MIYVPFAIALLLFSATGTVCAQDMPAAGDQNAPMDHAGTHQQGMRQGTASSSEPSDAGHMSHESMQMTGAYGAYPMAREASGTSWQPDTSSQGGIHLMRGDWMLMGHGLLNGVYDWQEGPRGDEKTFVSGMVMGMARRSLGSDTLQFRAMLSPDPLMGRDGLPLLLASGETANGRDPLVDRQHPHDLFMELSTSYSHALSSRDSLFVYAGLPGEPAFGPPAFMHRLSILDSPEPPIAHHWIDSTHITFGVLTAGYVHDDWKLEISRFHGREPDQYRYDFDTGPLDSNAVRLSWNPMHELSLQVSWAHVTSPEQLAPEEDQTKWSASAIWTRSLGAGAGWWSTTVAWGRRSAERAWLDAYVLESAIHPNDEWTAFARAERVENDELLLAEGQSHGPTFTVGKASAGVIRDFPLMTHVKAGLGALYSISFLPGALEPSYGGPTPNGAMVFVRLKVD
jgi:hypothetical protein